MIFWGQGDVSGSKVWEFFFLRHPVPLSKMRLSSDYIMVDNDSLGAKNQLSWHFIHPFLSKPGQQSRIFLKHRFLVRFFLMSHYLRHDNLIFIMVRTYNRHSCDFAGQENIFAELSVETIRKMSVSCFLQDRFSIVFDCIYTCLKHSGKVKKY